MAKKNVHVTPHGDKWAVKREGNERASSLHDTQKQAEDKGREAARKDKPYWESSEVPFFVKGPGVKSGTTRTALVNHTDLMPTTCAIAGISPASLDVDGRSMLTNLGRRTFSGWRKRMLISGSNDVGPEMNPGGSNDPSGRWWRLREGPNAFILRENGARELYWMKSDPHQERSKARTAKRALIERLTDTVKAMRRSSGETRRRLEDAP